MSIVTIKAMVTLLTGDNWQLVKEHLDSLIIKFQAKYDDFSTEKIDSRETTLSLVSQILLSLPMFNSAKQVIIYEPSLIDGFMSNAEQLINNLPDNLELIIVEPKLDKRSSYYQLLKDKTNFLEFKPLNPFELKRWLVNKAQSLGGKLKLNDADYLINRVGFDQALLSQEIEKLVLYDQNINQRTINLLTEATLKNNIFSLIEAAVSGNYQKAIELYREQRLLKQEPSKIIALISWQLHLLAVVIYAKNRTSAEIAKDSGINSYPIDKAVQLSRQLNARLLKSYISRLVDMELLIKSKKVDVDEALMNYFISLKN